jgi:glycosyltransferase involved in cell wall biosynthesis
VPNSIKKYKIALIGDSLSKGGAEKVHAILSIYFEKQGFEVHNCILIDGVTYNFSGSLLNLGKIKANSSSIIRKTYRFIALKKWVSSNNFDCLIDFRMRPSFILEFLLSRMIYPKNTIYTVHSGVLEFYFPRNRILSKLIYEKQKMVTVSDAIQKKIQDSYSLNKVQTIYNPCDLDLITVLKEDEIVETSYILAVGSMNSTIKQLDKLIEAYSKSDLPKQNIKLVILGEGKYKKTYQKLVENLNLSHLVLFKGIVQNPFPYYKNAIFYVLSSKNEGLPNAIIESLACETPVVSFDCFSGPREIISNNQNGILVDNQSFDKLVDAMNLMISDTELYRHCKDNSLKTVEKFSVEIIGKKWLEIIVS